MSESPMFSRRCGADRTVLELRCKVPVEVLSVVDAVSMADAQARGKAKSREEQVNEILREWAIRKRREASLIAAVCASNPPSAAYPGVSAEA